MAGLQAALGDKSEIALLGPIQGEVVAEQGDRQHWLGIQVGHRRDRVPVAAEQLATRRPRTHPREPLVRFSGQHAAKCKPGKDG